MKHPKLPLHLLGILRVYLSNQILQCDQCYDLISNIKSESIFSICIDSIFQRLLFLKIGTYVNCFRLYNFEEFHTFCAFWFSTLQVISSQAGTCICICPGLSTASVGELHKGTFPMMIG